MSTKGDPSLELSPWYSPEHRSWMFGQLPIAWFGLAVSTPTTRLPERWLSSPDGRGEVEPSDLEVTWVSHALAHEVARARGDELALLTSVCWPIEARMPDELLNAAKDGKSLVPWCRGPSWWWGDETRRGPFIDGRSRRMDAVYG